MASNGKVEFTLGFKLDKDGIQKAKSELDSLMTKIKESPGFGVDKDLKKAYESAMALKKALGESYNANFEKLGVDKFNKELRKAGLTLESVEKNLTQVGVKGAEAFNAIDYEIDKVGLKVKESSRLLNDMFDTFGKTVKWGISSSIMNQMASSVQRAVGYTKALDESLNNIRVVSGQNTSQMKAFTEEANEAAKALGKSTIEYTDASLIFFQQGKAAEEVRSLTEATLLGANVTGTDVAEMADLLTAVMNGYNVEANKALEVTDKLAAVGAATGSDFEELAVGMSKVASMANVAGVNIDQLNSMLATVTTVTREAPESIGTSFKTIFGRIAEVKAGKADEEGWDLGKVEDAFQKAGLTVLDMNNNMKDVGVIIEEVGSKWGGFNRETKMALANAMAGQRQANRLIALFENWGMYLDTVNTSQDALGATMEQNAVREESLAYQSKQLSANLEELWMNILNEDVLSSGMSMLNGIINLSNTFIESLGGISGAMAVLGGVALATFSKQIGGGITKSISKLDEFRRDQERIKMASQRAGGYNTPEGRVDTEGGSTSTAQDYLIAQQTRAMQLADGELKIKKYLSTTEHERYKKLTDIVNTEGEALTKAQARLKIAKELVREAGLEDKEITKESFKKTKSEIEASKSDATKTEAALEQLKTKENQRVVSKEKLLALMEKEGVKNLQLVQSIEKSKNGNIQIEEVQERINLELNTRQEQLETINRLEKEGLANVEKEAQAQEEKSGKLLQRTEKEISNLDKAAAKQERIEKTISYGAAMFTATAGIVSSMKAYSEAAGDMEKQNDAIVAGANSIGASLMMLPGPWFKVAGAITMATGVAVKWVRENTGIGKVLKDNQQNLDNYKKSLEELKESQNNLSQATAKMAQAQALAQDGLDPTEVEEYQTIVNDIAKSAPQTVAYYDAFGNAVLKSREEVEKLNESLKEQERILNASMQAQAGSFGAEVAYLQTQGKKEEVRLNEILKKQTEDLNKAYESGNSKKIRGAKEAIAETSQELETLRKQFDDIGQKTQEAIIDPFVRSEEQFKDISENLQGYVLSVFNPETIQEGLENITKTGDYSTAQLTEKSEEYLSLFKSGVEKVGTAFANLSKSQDEASAQLVQRLAGLPADAQKEISKQLLTVSVGLDDQAMLAEIGNLAKFIDEQGQLDTFGMVKYFRDTVGPSAKVSLSNNIRDGIIEGFNSAEVKDALETRSNAFGDSLAENISQALQIESRKQVSTGEYQDDGTAVMTSKYNDEMKAQLIELGNAFEQGNQELVNAILTSTPEVLEAVQSAVGGEVGTVFGTTQYRDAAEVVNSLVEKIRMQKEEQLLLNAALDEQGAIYSKFAEDMAGSIDGQQEIVDLWNQMVETTKEAGEGGLFSVDMEEEASKLETLTDAMYENNVSIAEASELSQELTEKNEELGLSAENIGKAFESMSEALGEDTFNDLIRLTGRTSDEIRSLAEEAKRGNIEAARSLQKEMGRVYGALNKDNVEYFQNFKKVNSDKLRLVAEFTGIEAGNYDTLAKFQEELELWKVGMMGRSWQDQTQMTNDALMKQMQNVEDASIFSMQYNGKTIDGASRAAALSSLIVAKNAVLAAQNGAEGGREASANMIDAMSQVDTAASAQLGAIADALRKKGQKFEWIIQYLDQEIAKLAEGASEGSADNFNLGGVSMPTLGDFNFSAPSGGIGRPSYSGGGGSAGSGSEGPSIGSGGDGGGGGDKGASEKEVEDLEWVKDIYHDINIEIQKNQILLDKLKKQQDKLYGKELLDNLAEQKKLLEQQQKLYEKKLSMQKEDLANQAKVLSQHGVTFDVDGTISNYNQLLEKKVAYVNSLSGEAKEAAKEEFSKLTELMQAYEDMMLNTIIETQNAIQDAVDAQRDIFLQQFEFSIQLKIDISEDLNKALDFIKEMNDDYEDLSENYERTTEQIAEQLELVERLKGQLEEINNNPDLSEKERLELLEKYNEELKSGVKELKNLEKELTKIFKDTLKDGLETVGEHLDQFKNLNDELKHLEQTLKLIGEEDNFGVLDSIYEKQYANIMGQIGVLNAQMSSLKAQRDALEASGMKGSEEWKAIDKAIQDTQKSINSLALESLKLLQTEFKNSVSEIMSSLEDAMTGGAGFDEIKKKQQELKDERKKYLDGEEKLLAISKLQKSVQKEIEETDDPDKKAKLQKFMDTELKNLKEKDKLTQYDVDRANAIYDLTLKQMALDDQRATKNIMRLVRDTQGNWVYEFTEDAKAIEKAQEEVSSSMEKLMELDKKKLEETQDLMLKLQEEYYKEVQQIANDAANGKYKTEEELRQALQEVTDKYNKKMEDANLEYEQAKKNATLSSMAVIVNTYKNTGDILGNLTDEQETLLKALAEKTDGTYLDLAETVNGLLSGDEDSIKSAMEDLGFTTEEEMSKISGAINGMIDNMHTNWGTDVSDMISDFIGGGGLQEATTSTIDSIVDKWNEYQQKIDEVQKEAGLDLDTIKDKIEATDKATEELNKQTEALINKFKDEMDAVTKLTTAYQKNREEIGKTIDKLLEYIQTIDKAIDAIKRKNDAEVEASKPKPPPTTGGGGSSSGGSGGGGSTTPPKPNPTPPALAIGSQVRVKSGRRWYYDSYGMNPSGQTDPYADRDLQITSMNNSGSKPINVGTGPGVYLGWLTKEDLVGYDTGGYTGSWGDDGKVAMLHEKEIVLNKADTKNILDTVKMVRGISSSTLDNIASTLLGTSRRAIEALSGVIKTVNPVKSNDSNGQIVQNVNINADFSGVRSADEIEKAFENMDNIASQYINRR